MAASPKPARGTKRRTGTFLGAQGRFVLPSAVREATGLKQGDRLVVLVEEGGILLLTPEQAVRRAQDLARKWIRPGRDPVKELLEERRREVRREMREAERMRRRAKRRG